MDTTNNENVYDAKEVTEVDRFWLSLGQETLKESLGILDGAAKQLISIVSILQGIYFAAISFSNLKQILIVQNIQGGLLVFVLILPIAFWLTSLAFATNVFTPRPYSTNLSSPQIAKETHDDAVDIKHKQLHNAHLFLVAGFVPLLISIVGYLVWL
ncbi:MAG: hypothetical protein ACXV3D_00320 [Halobacteriota archaeon]